MLIGIIGAMGFVGSAVYSTVAKHYECVLYDTKLDNLHKKWKDCLNCHMLIACLPTPVNEDKSGQSTIVYQNFFNKLADDGYKGIVVVKSTILYENVEPWLDRLNIVINPEFLNASTAIDDFANQTHIVLGGRIDHVVRVEDMYKRCLGPDIKIIYCTHKEAIDCKYAHNVINAMKVLMYTMIADNVDDYRKVLRLYCELRGTKESIEMSRICADGKFKGAGGACFYKDLIAWNSTVDNPMLKGAVEYNEELHKKA